MLALQLAAASEVVLDGEMMAWDTTAEKFVAFGNTITVAKEMADKATGASSAATARHLSYYAFDMVWVRGWKAHPELDGDLTLMTLDKRRQVRTRVHVCASMCSCVPGNWLLVLN